MGNLCSIFHANFDKLITLTNCHKKAVFLDKCLFWWQISTYTLNDNKIWFTRKHAEMSAETKIPERSIGRYLKEFVDNGWLERACRLSPSSKDGFKVTKRLYIHVTPKLLALIKREANKPHSNFTAPSSISFVQNGKIEKATMASSIYKEKHSNPVNNSTVIQEPIVDNFDVDQNVKTATDITKPVYPVESLIGERITPRLKNYIKGMIRNVQEQHGVRLSNPNQLFAEVVFSVSQPEQWQQVPNTHHRVNIIAKLLRQNCWKTPKGFFNHWDVGQFFREQQAKADAQAHKLKFAGTEPSRERSFHYTPETPRKQNREQQKTRAILSELINTIQSQEQYLRMLESMTATRPLKTDTLLINQVAVHIAELYQEKACLQELLRENNCEAA